MNIDEELEKDIEQITNNELFDLKEANFFDIQLNTQKLLMDYLLGASLVQVTRKSRKVFYSINKDLVRKSILSWNKS